MTLNNFEEGLNPGKDTAIQTALSETRLIRE